MSYNRVIPRDLFNEAGLLKCLGKLIIAADTIPGLEFEHDGEAFAIVQDPSDGSISVANVVAWLNGMRLDLSTGLNARRSMPLEFRLEGGEDGLDRVFNEDGSLSDEFKAAAKLT